MTARLRAMLARTITCCRSAPSAPIRLTCAMSSAQASWFAPTVLPLSSVDSPVRGQPYRGGPQAVPAAASRGLARRSVSARSDRAPPPQGRQGGRGRCKSAWRLCSLRERNQARTRPITGRTTLTADLYIPWSEQRLAVRHPEDAGGAETGAAKPGYGAQAGPLAPPHHGNRERKEVTSSRTRRFE
jgi:hypothetical protein